MKKIIPIALLYFLMHTASAQRWITTFGTPNSYDYVNDIVEDYDKGYYLVGRGEQVSPNGNGWNIKTNINGGLLWDKNLVYPGKMIGNATCQDSNGNKYVTGVDFTDDNNTPFVVKLNACGEKVWCSLLKHWDFLWGYTLDIIINNDGNIVVLARFE
ncbi:MAG: hypothetical protein ACOYMF_14920, partial [Bacteroidales bacterium]